MPDPKVRDTLRKSTTSPARMTELVDEVREVTEQLHPERARSCRNAITMCRVMVDEIRLRAHGPPARRTRTVARRLGLACCPSAYGSGAVPRPDSEAPSQRLGGRFGPEQEPHTVLAIAAVGEAKRSDVEVPVGPAVQDGIERLGRPRPIISTVAAPGGVCGGHHEGERRGGGSDCHRETNQVPAHRCIPFVAVVCAPLVRTRPGKGMRRPTIRWWRWHRTRRAADGRREGADVMTRARLFWAGLLAAATTAVLVGAPAMVHAGISFQAME
jgi:hypothetical protein